MTPKLHLYIHTPVPIFKARVNMSGTISYPVARITYDGVTLGSFSDVAFDATLLLGTTDGADDSGRVRVKSVPSSTQIPISRSSKGIEDGTITIQDNAYITILDDYRVWAKIPYFDLVAGVDYKDGDVPPGDYNEEIPPVANTGPGFADYIDLDTSVITVQFPKGGVDLSYAVSEGATITGYAWDVKDGTITVGDADDAVITATFPAGFRYVGLTVTDSNGKSHSARCPVLAINTAADPTIKSFSVQQRLEVKGQTLDIQIHDELPRATYPDGTLVMYWWDSASSPGSRDHMKFIGWLDKENYSVGRNKVGLARSATLHCIDVCGRLSILPGFAQALERVPSDSLWSFMPNLDISKSLFYLLFWHSTALNIADFILPENGDAYNAMRIDAVGASLFDQVNNQAQKIVPDHYLTCNSQGQMIILEDWNLIDEDDRPDPEPVITEAEWNDISMEYNRHPKVHVLRSGAILASTDFVEEDGVEVIPLVFSVAPGDAEAFGQGLSEQVESEGLALSQDALNKSEGHRYALLNSRFGDFTLQDPTGYNFWNYEPALMKRVQLNISASKAAQRGLPFTTANGQVKSIDIRYNVNKKGMSIVPSVTWKKEEVGYPAVTHVPEDSEDVGYVPVAPLVPDFNLIPGQEVVAGIGVDYHIAGEDTNLYVYRTSDFQTTAGGGGPTWDRVDLGDVGEVFSFVVDPFSPGYIDGVGAINGWVATWDTIYRIEDFFGTPSKTAVYTFDNVVAIEDGHWRTIQASFGNYFAEGTNPWLLCISYYGGFYPGHTGTWCSYSTDGGVTWSAEVLVSAHYNSSFVNRKNPIGVYASPKTPGLAYTAAHLETSPGALTDGYVSTDWGATWTAMSTIEPPANFVRWVQWDNDTSPGNIIDNQVDVFSYSFTTVADDTHGVPGVAEAANRVTIAPPANAVRMEVYFEWIAINEATGTQSAGANYNLHNPTGASVSRSAPDFDYTDPPDDTTTSGDFTVVWTKTGGADWPQNFGSTFTTTISGAGVSHLIIASGTIMTVTTSMQIIEIELANGTIYSPSIEGWLVPGMSQAGSIHLPWPTNADEGIAFYGFGNYLIERQFRLKAANAGVVTDVSPDASGILYGVNHYGFAVRSYDDDRAYMAFGGVGNDTDNSPASDKTGLWVSDDNGATWTNILTPVAISNVLYGLQIAFSGSNPDVLFAWGANSDGSVPAIQYSDDFGATLDSREGNIDTLGSVAFIGIAGGPG